MIRPESKRKAPAKLSQPVLKFVDEASLHATAHEQSWSFSPAKVLTYAALDDQSPDVFITDSLLEQQEWKAKKWTWK